MAGRSATVFSATLVGRTLMRKIDALYRWLARNTSPDVDRALAAALDHAEPEYAERIAELLVGRKRETAWIGLVANYDRLGPQHQRRLHEPTPLVCNSIAAAMKGGSARGRQNALTLLTQCRCPQLSYLVADALRDRSPQVRTAATGVLRSLAKDALATLDQARAQGHPPSAEFHVEHSELVRALRDALGSFDSHVQPAILELCLWFARDLGSSLWEVVGEGRSACARILSERLESWDSPRLAGFLLLALGRDEWRTPARRLLDSWNSSSHLIALMRNSDLLAQPTVRRGLRLLKRPAWFVANVSVIAKLPPDVRGQLPYWLRWLGMTHTEQMHYLENWQASHLPELHRAAVYSLAAMDTPTAYHYLRQVAARPCPMHLFARWFLHGRQLAAGHGSAGAAARPQRSPAGATRR